MPRPTAPPTPGNSSDLRGKEAAQNATLAPFNLPPTAYTDDRERNSSTPSNNGSDSSYRPVSPSLPAGSKRPAGAIISKEDFELPPPPTRSRKIIQMKPQADLPIDNGAAGAASQQSSKPQAGKKKQGAGTTAAGRKIARKTAHSLIERRRRSKMNDEFDVLKNMIPACKGQEMHKLAILSASIDYLRYLEKCVADLQQNNKTSPTQQQRPPQRGPPQGQLEEEEDDEDEDEEMQDDAPTPEQPQPRPSQPQSAVSTPGFRPLNAQDSQISLPSLSTITTTSPSIFSTYAGAGRHYSISSASQASYSPYFRSAHTSPAFGPQLSHHASVSSAPHAFGIGSPALKPLDRQHTSGAGASEELSLARPATRPGRSEQDPDQEAAGGLLMLNNDRRRWEEKEARRQEQAAAASAATKSAPARGASSTGMSVKDLLSG